MKRPLLYTLLFCGLSAASLPAQEGPPPGDGGPRPPMPVIAALDLDHDGTISAEEIARASESLKTLDKNGDGKITAEEFRPPHPDGPDFPRQGPADGPPRRPQPPRGAPAGDQERPPLPDAPPRRDPAPARPQAGPPDQGPPRGAAPGRPEEMRPVPPVLLALDGNGDGVIDATEIARAAESLKTLDKNGDGQLSPEELRPRPPGGPDTPRGGGPDARRPGQPRPGRDAGGPPDRERPQRPRGPENRPERPQ